MLVSIGSRSSQPDDLAGHLFACHERIRRFLRLASTASGGGGSSQEIADACGQIARYFREAFPLHVRDEEDSILPRLRQLSPEVESTLSAMETQHRGHEAPLRELLEATARLGARPADPTCRAALEAAAEAFARDVEPYLALEERELFPTIRRMPAAIQAEISAEMKQRRTR